MKIEIDLDGYTEGQFIATVVELVLDKVQGEYEDTLANKLDTLLREKVETAVATLIEDGVRAKVEEVLAAGITIGGPYNKSEPMSVADVLRKKLTEPHDRSQLTLAETIAKRVLDEAMSKDLRTELDAIRAKFKAQVDQVLASKLLEIVRSVERA